MGDIAQVGAEPLEQLTELEQLVTQRNHELAVQRHRRSVAERSCALTESNEFGPGRHVATVANARSFENVEESLDITPDARDVMMIVVTRGDDGVMTAPAAADAAGITYRQLDHWARRGWVTPSWTDTETYGRPVRMYTTLDVARLGALCHFARSGHDIATLGPAIGQLALAVGAFVVVDGDGVVTTVTGPAAVVAAVTLVGSRSVFDPSPLLAAGAASQHSTTARIRVEEKTA